MKPSASKSAQLVALQTALYAPRARDETTICREVEQATCSMAEVAARWSLFLPTRSAVETMRTKAAGLSRLLTELAAKHPEGGRDDD